jgi:hypothetical protein
VIDTLLSEVESDKSAFKDLDDYIMGLTVFVNVQTFSVEIQFLIAKFTIENRYHWLLRTYLPMLRIAWRIRCSFSTRAMRI